MGNDVSQLVEGFPLDSTEERMVWWKVGWALDDLVTPLARWAADDAARHAVVDAKVDAMRRSDPL